MRAERFNRLTGERSAPAPGPVRCGNPAPRLRHGGPLLSGCPGAPGGRVDEELFEAVLGTPFDGRALLLRGPVRLLRGPALRADGRPRPLRQSSPPPHGPAPAVGRQVQPALRAHPYDLCTELAAREAGVVVTGMGRRAAARPRSSVRTPVDWAAYANSRLAELVHPLLQEALRKRGLWTGPDTPLTPCRGGRGEPRKPEGFPRLRLSPGGGGRRGLQAGSRGLPVRLLAGTVSRGL